MTTPTPTPASACVNQQATCNATRSTSKDLWIVRHGQATHNPRAEAAKAAGCSHETFMQLMQQDDSLDSPLTALGVEQGQAAHKRYQSLWKSSAFFDLVVASPLSRALHTADLVLPPPPALVPLAGETKQKKNRVCHESFREIHGWLRNAQRQPRRVLQDKFPNWDFSLLQSEEDEWWTETLETHQACAQRGVDGLTWILQRPEENRILLVAHGGLLRFTMAEFGHKVVMVDGRTDATTRERSVQERFANCEVRRYRLSWDDPTLQHKGKLVLTEVDVC